MSGYDSTAGWKRTRNAQTCNTCGAAVPPQGGWYCYTHEERWPSGADHAYTYTVLNIICDKCLAARHRAQAKR